MCGRLGVDYIDLVYFHQPVGDFVGGWKEMEKALESGKVRAIGISNFDVNDSIWNSIVENCRIVPQIVQIECHPYAQREHWQKMAAKHNIQIECWFPLGGRESKGELVARPRHLRDCQGSWQESRTDHHSVAHADGLLGHPWCLES